MSAVARFAKVVLLVKATPWVFVSHQCNLFLSALFVALAYRLGLEIKQTWEDAFGESP